jgi:hypothetical protein
MVEWVVDDGQEATLKLSRPIWGYIPESSRSQWGILHTQSSRSAVRDAYTRSQEYEFAVICTCCETPCTRLNANPAKLFTRREQQNPQKLSALPGLKVLALQSILNNRTQQLFDKMWQPGPLLAEFSPEIQQNFSNWKSHRLTSWSKSFILLATQQNHVHNYTILCPTTGPICTLHTLRKKKPCLISYI